MSTRLERRVVAKTAAYSINPVVDKPGTVFTNRGAAGSVTFTLPAPNSALTGWHYRFLGIADFAVVVATLTADTLITLNDVAADSVAIGTSGQIIGGVIEAFCDGTSWMVSVASIGHAATIVTN